ncbi:hypothetical protein, partial [Palleronia rufa]|uniref:hypothetical protein n=1 Tax=Palleronia rufa TaxID=1530186 RepID=UPI0039EE3183
LEGPLKVLYPLLALHLVVGNSESPKCRPVNPLSIQADFIPLYFARSKRVANSEEASVRFCRSLVSEASGFSKSVQIKRRAAWCAVQEPSSIISIMSDGAAADSIQKAALGGRTFR